ncbi:MAG: glutathione S-transferase [Gammaproteobacteria bacterium]|nr:glutathione S-transferase [Gammaproteobacteria bacterium]
MQRAVIVMRAKDVDFEVTYINLRDKPGWFLKISPHGKVPVLQVDGEPLFESNAIAEYLDEAVEPRLHPVDPVKRARNRAWTDFVPTFAGALMGLYYGRTKENAEGRTKAARQRLNRLEEAIANERGNDGPYFNGPQLCLVDAAYAPFLQRFLIVEQWLQSGVLDDYPLVNAWAHALVESDIVTGSVPDNFMEEFEGNIRNMAPEVAARMDRKSA